MSAGTAWYAVRVSPLVRSMDRIEQLVQRLGFVVWWPKLTELQKRPQRAVGRGVNGGHRWTHDVRITPLFPRYVLVALPAFGAPFGKLNDDQARAFGLFGVLGTSGGPVVIPDAIVDDLKRREADGEFNLTMRHGRKVIAKRPSWLVAGVTAVVDDGPFRGFNAVIEELVAADRARVSVTVFGRSTALTLDADQLVER